MIYHFKIVVDGSLVSGLSFSADFKSTTPGLPLLFHGGTSVIAIDGGGAHTCAVINDLTV